MKRFEEFYDDKQDERRGSPAQEEPTVLIQSKVLDPPPWDQRGGIDAIVTLTIGQTSMSAGNEGNHISLYVVEIADDGSETDHRLLSTEINNRAHQSSNVHLQRSFNFDRKFKYRIEARWWGSRHPNNYTQTANDIVLSYLVIRGW